MSAEFIFYGLNNSPYYAGDNNLELDFFMYSTTSFTEEEISIISGTYNTNTAPNDKLYWGNHRGAKILCNYEVDEIGLNSNSSGEITNTADAFEIYKKLPQEEIYNLVGSYTVTELNNGIYSYLPPFTDYQVQDYNIKNNSEYTYVIYPINEDFVGSSNQIKIKTEWENFTLSGLIKNSKNNYTIGHDTIWNFILNCEEGSYTQQLDKTIFTTFTKMPKVSIGQLNYATGSFQALLGTSLENGQYYEPTYYIKKWEDFVNKYDCYLFKNKKGDCKIVSIDSGVVRTYMNEVANHYINYYEENSGEIITSYPTSIQFNFTEIIEGADITITKVGD